ncbi:MAG: ribosome maturation factor RimP [Solirubrobacterales bacterium]|nr:ribosome maturation factor RimP [Solirubrobacterales bacterium]
MKPDSTEIEQRLAGIDPEIEFLALEQAGGDSLRLFIDHPDGVTLELCQRVTSNLTDLLVEHSLEVSSPGPERPLTRPEHFVRFKGRRAKVRTVEPIEDRRNFTGTILEAEDQEVALGFDGREVRIPYGSVARSHLVPDTAEGAAK